MHGRRSVRGYCSDPARGEGVWVQRSNSGTGEWWVGTRYRMKVNAIGFPDYWDVGCGRKRKVEDDFKDLGLSNGTMGLIPADVGKVVSGAGFGEKIRNSVLTMWSLICFLDIQMEMLGRQLDDLVIIAHLKLTDRML